MLPLTYNFIIILSVSVLNKIVDKGASCKTSVLTSKVSQKSLLIFPLVNVFVRVVLISHISFNGTS
jgi:hypothetical protein